MRSDRARVIKYMCAWCGSLLGLIGFYWVRNNKLNSFNNANYVNYTDCNM